MGRGCPEGHVAPEARTWCAAGSHASRPACPPTGLQPGLLSLLLLFPGFLFISDQQAQGDRRVPFGTQAWFIFSAVSSLRHGSIACKDCSSLCCLLAFKCQRFPGGPCADFCPPFFLALGSLSGSTLERSPPLSSHTVS